VLGDPAIPNVRALINARKQKRDTYTLLYHHELLVASKCKREAATDLIQIFAFFGRYHPTHVEGCLVCMAQAKMTWIIIHQP